MTRRGSGSNRSREGWGINIGIVIAILILTSFIWVPFLMPHPMDMQQHNDLNHEMLVYLVDGDGNTTSVHTTGTVLSGVNPSVYLTRGSSVTVTFNSPQPGPYTLTLYSSSSMDAYPSTLDVSVNGEPATAQSFDVNQSNCVSFCIQTAPITVTLNAGQNTVTISNSQPTSTVTCNTNDKAFGGDLNGGDLNTCNFIQYIRVEPVIDYTSYWIKGIVVFVLIAIAAFGSLAIEYSRGRKSK